MDTQNKIQGKKRRVVFEQLQNENTLIKMHIPKLDYEKLTMIIDVRRNGNDSFFIIDSPNDFHDNVTDFDQTEIHFEFNFKEGVRYAFKSAGGMILENEIWIVFPDIIERIQRRKDFRLGFPKGSRIRFQLKSIEHEMDLINLSMGGAYADISMNKKGEEKNPFLKSGNTVHNIILWSPSEEGNLEVLINEASIIRVEKLKTGKRCKLGLQFIDIDSTEVKTLKKLVYDIQRNFLQRRLKPDV